MSTDLGARAETLAAEYLRELGFKVLERNHRTRYSELDIIAERGGVVHFVEVKFRSNPDFGGGAEYISRDKLRRLTRAADIFMSFRNLERPYQIDVVSVDGDIEKPTITLIENVTA